jgi:quercetin dioxygenase-like cupin family protein
MASVPDVMVAAKGAYGVLLENEAVRVMEVRLKPGQKAPMHNHPRPHVVYVKTDSRLKLTFPDGKDNVIDLKAGQTLWLDAGPHEAENVGKTDFDNLVIEVKK